MDMLIRLHGALFDPHAAVSRELEPTRITLRKPIGPEHHVVTHWITGRFGAAWASEAQVALANHPTSMVVATGSESMLGFCCYDATARGYVGPIGVAEEARGTGIGAALLLACLHDMRTMGYGYAIAGAVGAPEFFRRVAGATEIEGSTPGIYRGMLRP